MAPRAARTTSSTQAYATISALLDSIIAQTRLQESRINPARARKQRFDSNTTIQLLGEARTTSQRRTSTRILVLRKRNCTGHSLTLCPNRPSSGFDDFREFGVLENNTGVFSPWTTKVERTVVGTGDFRFVDDVVRRVGIVEASVCCYTLLASLLSIIGKRGWMESSAYQ